MKSLAALIVILGLASCSASSIGKAALGAAVGGGPNVAANGQAGKTNSQTIGTSKTVETSGPQARPRDVGRDFVQTTTQTSDEIQTHIERVENLNQTPAWLVIAFGIALFLDSPLRWPGQVMAGFRKKSAS